jgi:hypothetical protein
MIELRIQSDPKWLDDVASGNQFGKGLCGANGSGKQLTMPQVPVEQVEIILVRVNRYLNSRMRSVRIYNITPSTVMPILRNVVAPGANTNKLANASAARYFCTFRQTQRGPERKLALEGGGYPQEDSGNRSCSDKRDCDSLHYSAIWRVHGRTGLYRPTH